MKNDGVWIVWPFLQKKIVFIIKEKNDSYL